MTRELKWAIVVFALLCAPLSSAVRVDSRDDEIDKFKKAVEAIHRRPASSSYSA